MISFSYTDLFFGVLSIFVIFLVLCIYVMGLNRIRLFSKKTEDRAKSIEKIMAVNIKPKIKVEFIGQGQEKSKLINELKMFLEDHSKQHNGVDVIENTITNNEEFIPEPDQEQPDLVLIESTGPEIKEKDEPNSSAGDVEYIQLKDL